MNYQRVYEEFIEARRQGEISLEGYVESHHIVPRCLGGGDGAENLILLTPEDHYFAHLLLAYAYGGKNWVAVHAMCYLVNKHHAEHRSRLRARVQFGHVRRSLAAHYRDILSGPNSKISDKRKFELRNFDGRIVTGNRFELADFTGVTRQQISAVLRGVKKNAHGWYSPLHNPEGMTRRQLMSNNRRSQQVLTLYHFDGREWRGTQWDFNEQFGCRLVFQHPNGCVKGWYRTADDASTHGSLRQEAVNAAAKARGSIDGADNPNADPKIYNFVVVATGEVVSATKMELRDRFGLKSKNLCTLFNGRQRQTGGISLLGITKDTRLLRRRRAKATEAAD